MTGLIKSILLVSTFFSFSGFANTDADFISVNNEVRELASPIENVFDETMTSWEMYRVRVRTRLEFGIEIPLLAKFKIKPEIELFFDKR